MDHEGKVAIITGAASGIGKATSRIFAAEGARLVLGDVNAVGAKDVEAELRGRGADAVAVGSWDIEVGSGLNQADHRVAGLAALDAVRDADNT